MWPSGGPAPAPASLQFWALLVLTPSGLFQFLPGRIDHHNVQILCAVGGILLLQRAITQPAAGWWAGSLMALGLAVGLEALPLVAAALGLACLLACFDVSARAGACRAVIALAIGLVASYAITTHPTEWLTVACDALSPNLLALCGSGAVAAYILRSRFSDAPAWIWVSGFGAAGAIGLGAYFGAQPNLCRWCFCRNGRSSQNPMAISLALLIRQALETRSTNHIFMAASTLLACLYGFYYIKLLPYGNLLALVPIACWIAQLPARAEMSVFSVRLAAVLATSQVFYGLLAGLAIGLFSDIETNAKEKMSASVSRCYVKSDIAALSALPPGLIISDIDLGPFIAVSTRHRAYAGPYHRIHKSIGDLLALQAAPLSEAGQQLAKMNADYLVFCGVTPKQNTKAPEAKAEARAVKFSTHMRRGGNFEGLEPVSIGKTVGPLRVWKIVKAQ